MANWWSSSSYGGVCLYAVLCPTFAIPSSFSVGEGKTVQVVTVSRTGRVMWLEFGWVPPLLYAIAAGSTTSSLRARQVPRCWQRGRAGIKHESRSGTQAAIQKECASWGAGSMLSPGAAQRGCCQYRITQPWPWNWTFFEKWGENEPSFSQLNSILVRRLKGSLLNWEAKRFRMSGCAKHIVKDRVQNLAGQWQENSPFANLIGMRHTHGGRIWAFPSGTSD